MNRTVIDQSVKYQEKIKTRPISRSSANCQLFNKKLSSMEMSFEKSNKMADEYRTEGNRCYIRKQFLDALIYYNKSLCFAEQGSESLAFAFANRASVYLELKLFRKCLKNIELARDNYPIDKLRILNERESKCQNLMKNNYERERKMDNWDFFELTHPANKRIPYIADCLEVKSNEKYGRYIITNIDLSVGDIVAIEEPSCQILFDVTKSYSYCVYCCKDELLDLLPCSDCVTSKYSLFNLIRIHNCHYLFQQCFVQQNVKFPH